MIEISPVDPSPVASSTEELFARILPYVGNTILVQHQRTLPFAGRLGWIRMGHDYINFDIGRQITEQEPNYPQMTIHSAVRVLIDGQWTMLNEPAWAKSASISSIVNY